MRAPPQIDARSGDSIPKAREVRRQHEDRIVHLVANVLTAGTNDRVEARHERLRVAAAFDELTATI